MSIYDEIDVPRDVTDLEISQEGLDLIKHFEGVRLNAYQDTGGVWTIGVGHTKTTRPGMRITNDQVDELLREDLKDAHKGIVKLVQRKLYQRQYDALMSFVFNLGETQFRSSTLLKRVNACDDDDVMFQLRRWRFDNGQELLGLLRRRVAEGLLYEGNDWKEYDNHV